MHLNLYAAPKNFDYSGLDSYDSETTKPKKPWTKEEDELLCSLVEDSDTKPNWIIIASKIKNHNVRSCKDRYELKFKSNGIWTQEDDELLMSLISDCGCRWKTISKKFKNHSAESCKNRYNFIKRSSKEVSYVLTDDTVSSDNDKIQDINDHNEETSSGIKIFGKLIDPFFSDEDFMLF